MNVTTYLRYNNIALIDPQVDFHSSCIAQFEAKGYLSSKQLDHLRSWNHSTSAIARLTANAPEVEETPTAVEPVVSTVSKGKWSDTDLINLFDTIAASPTTTLEDLAEKLNRTTTAVRGALYKNSDCVIRKNVVVHCVPNEDELPF